MDSVNNNHKRRQSEPPQSTSMSNDNDDLIFKHPRDDQYIKALSKFNEWRINRFNASFSGRSHRKNSEKNNKLLTHRLYKNPSSVNTNTEESDNISSSTNNENNLNLKNIYEEIENKNKSSNSSSQSSIYHVSGGQKNCIISNFKGGRKIKMGSKSLGGKPLDTNDNIQRSLYENEIKSFEKIYCSQGMQTIETVTKCYNYDGSVDNMQSPPIKFYKENSIPFIDSKSPKMKHLKGKRSDALYSSPLKLNYLNKNQNNNLKKTKSKITVCTVKNCNEHIKTKSSHQKFGSNISLASDDYGECIVYDDTNNKEFINGSMSKQKTTAQVSPVNDENKKKCNDKEEFHLEFQSNNRNVDTDCNRENDSKQISESQMCIDKNFEFLNNSTTSLQIENQGKDIPITDLDQSNGDDFIPEISKNFNEDIMDELRSLELWSQSLNLIPTNNSQTKNDRNLSGKHLNLSGTYSCYLKELKPRITVFRNSFKCPIVFQSGIFRTTSVSLFTFDHSMKKNGIRDYALQKNYLTMRKLRHINVALLMAICIDDSNNIISLILEPFKSTLNDVIHKNHIEIRLNICITYILQLINGLKYMHENGLIHSNISSHAILIDNYQKQVKLSAFELSTHLNNNSLQKLEKFESDPKFDESKLSKDNLPYWIDYRKIYSQHQYQPPELIQTKQKFVFPTIKSDIYGITLLFWEMLNNRVPYEFHDYYDLEKLYKLNQIKLPISDNESCKLFEDILSQGLRINPEERFGNLDVIKLYLEEFETNIFMQEVVNSEMSPFEKQSQLETESLLEFSKLLRKRYFGSREFDRTSTAKKKKGKKSPTQYNRLSAKELFRDKNIETNHSKNISIKVTSGSKTEKKEPTPTHKITNEMSRDDDYYAQTPIAKNNHFLKNAMHVKNSSKTNSPVNVRICITQNLAEESTNVDSVLKSSENTDIGNQIKFWNNLTVPSSKDTHEIIKTHKRSKTTPNQILKNSKNENMKPFKEDEFRNNFENFFSKSKEDNFENMLWKREKEKCEQISPRNLIEDFSGESGVITPRRISVRETVFKFENYLHCQCVPKIVSFDETYETEKDLSFNANHARIIESQEVEELSSSEIGDRMKENTCSKNISTLHVMLHNDFKLNKDKDEGEVSEKSETTELKENAIIPLSQLRNQQSQAVLLSLNLKKLARRASDVGYSSFKIQNKIPNIRHSISGTDENFRQHGEMTVISADCLNKISFLNVSRKEQLLQLSNNDEKEAIENPLEKKIIKVKCLNCGCQKFIVNEETQNLDRQVKLIGPRQSFGIISQNIKSLEDLYIDDDFNTGMGANFKLGGDEGQSEELSGLINFDILSAEIFDKSNVDF